ncbi:hypothetical protein HDU97_010251 [Phlyctochytrium planicorne]|nr:hypothetical protein HDU97_010251 [Phlyctochytrium planicorne]
MESSTAVSSDASPRSEERKKNLIIGEVTYFARNFTLSEISGAFGDFGTLLPILVGLSRTNQISLTASLVFGGVFNIIAGFVFRIPICVQPMKAISAVALASAMPSTQVAAAGFWVSAIVLILSVTRTLSVVNRILPLPLIRGIQLGTGLQLINNGITSVLAGYYWSFDGAKWMDNLIIAGVVYVGAMVMLGWKRNPAALILFFYGLIAALVKIYAYDKIGIDAGIGPAFPTPFVPSWYDFRIAFEKASLGQLPLTILNSVIAVSKLADDLFPDREAPVVSVTSVGSAVGLMNIVSMWFGSIPYCHGSGGLAGQYRFGARTHVSVVLLGIAKVAVGLLFGSALIKILASFPNTVLGVMLCLSGIEIAAMMKDVGGTDAGAYNRMVIVIVTGGVCAAWKNDGVGFSVGAVTTFILWSMDRKEKGESVLGGVKDILGNAFGQEKQDLIEKKRSDVESV